jgi:hypothetical protein
MYKHDFLKNTEMTTAKGKIKFDAKGIAQDYTDSQEQVLVALKDVKEFKPKHSKSSVAESKKQETKVVKKESKKDTKTKITKQASKKVTKKSAK